MLREQAVPAAFPAQDICQYKVVVGNLEICLPLVGSSKESAVTAHTGKPAGIPAVLHTDPLFHIIRKRQTIQVKGNGSHEKGCQDFYQLLILRPVIMAD